MGPGQGGISKSSQLLLNESRTAYAFKVRLHRSLSQTIEILVEADAEHPSICSIIDTLARLNRYNVMIATNEYTVVLVESRKSTRPHFLIWR